MTDERLKEIEKILMELLNEVKRARQSEKICRAAAMIYKGREPVKLRRIA